MIQGAKRFLPSTHAQLAVAAVVGLALAFAGGTVTKTRAPTPPSDLKSHPGHQASKPSLALSAPLSPMPKPSAAPLSSATKAEWNVQCDISHFNADDPIVSPGQPGNSHMHSFYGNTSTDAYTTTATLMGSRSDCINGMGRVDHSAYWVPSLYKVNQAGAKVLYANGYQTNVVYYRRAGGVAGPEVEPFPKGLRMIAGDSKATSPQPIWMVMWGCGQGGQQYPDIPICSDPSQPLHASLVFPSCWDGVHLDSADHKSHMAYADRNGSCPSSHPVSLPEVVFEVDYPRNGIGPHWMLSSGSVYSFHGDFFAAWDDRAQRALIASCLNRPFPCGDMYHEGDTLFSPTSEVDPITIDMSKY